MNIPILILFIILFIMVIVIGILSFRNIKVISDNEKGIYVLDLSQTPCYPNGSISGLTGIGGTGCCVVNGVTTSRRIFTISSNQQMLVDTTPVFFADVCLEFCQTFDTVKNRCTDSITGSGPYAQCINALNPINSSTTDSIATRCTQPSLPVARVGDTPYYAVEVYIPPTSSDTGNCPSIVSC
jgi:hypothetical protein